MSYISHKKQAGLRVSSRFSLQLLVPQLHLPSLADAQRTILARPAVMQEPPEAHPRKEAEAAAEEWAAVVATSFRPWRISYPLPLIHHRPC
jgi:hypothetical protein